MSEDHKKEMSNDRYLDLSERVFEVPDSMTRIKKGWGRDLDGVGEIFAYHVDQEQNPINVETVKLLYVKKDKRLSKHFHKLKDEFFICVKGEFYVELWDDDGTEFCTFTLKSDQRVFIPKLLRHRLTGKAEENILLEVSTKSLEEDSHRIEKGD